MSDYHLSEEDVDNSDDDPPVIRAARNSNPLVLTAVLKEGARLMNELEPTHPSLRSFSPNTCISGAIHGIYNSPLVESIKAGLPQNVSTLLAAGADPNGILLGDLDEYSVRFIRGRNPKYDTYSFVMCPPRIKEMTKVGDGVTQTEPLTPIEIATRSKGFARFWSEPELPVTRYRSTAARTALETAASVGDIALFDQVRAAGPDESWWTMDSTPPHLPDNLTHSALCTSSPIHEAIISGQTHMLKHLLSIGYSPNLLPLAAPTRCLPPHAAAIALCIPPNLVAYDILAEHPTTDLTLCTPIFSIHVLHFATARLDIPLLQHISGNPATSLESAGTTALGHTLLHIAALPLTDLHTNLFSPKIFRSIHDLRTLATKGWYPADLRRHNPANRGILSAISDTWTLPHPLTPEDETDARMQAATVLWLLESGTQNLAAQDVYGNTPLHYLVSAMWVDEELLNKLKVWRGGEAVWERSKNELGFSPKDLWEDGKAADIE